MKSREDNVGNKSQGLFGIFEVSPWAVNIFKVYLADILSTIIGGATILLLIRRLSLDDYASFTVFNTIFTLIPGLVGNGINLALIRFSSEYLSKTGKKPNDLYAINFAFQTLIYSLIVIVVALFHQQFSAIIFGVKSFGPVLPLGVGAGFGVLLAQAAMSAFKAEERFGVYIRILWLNKSIVFAFVYSLFLLKKLTFLSAAGSFLVAHVGIGVLIAAFILKDFKARDVIVRFKAQAGIVKEFLVSTGWLISYFFILAVFQRFDIFFLSHYSSKGELANYGVAFQYYSLAMILLGSVSTVLLPKFSRVDMQDPLRQREFIRKWLKATSWILLPILIVDVFGKPLFIWINGTQYKKGFYIFVVFSFGAWLSLLLSPLMNVLLARKAFKFLFVVSGVALVSNAGLNFLLVPIWGGVGAALVLVLSHNVLLQGISFVKIITSNQTRETLVS